MKTTAIVENENVEIEVIEHKRFHCPSCRQETAHILRGVEPYVYSVGDYEDKTINFRAKWFWVCAGCNFGILEDTVIGQDRIRSMQSRMGWEVWMDDSDLESDLVSFQNDRAHEKKYFLSVPAKLNDLYGQTVSAYNGNLSVLAAAGLRALFEGICADREVAAGHQSLERKIDALEKLGLPHNTVKNLHEFRFIGNEALHELKSPEREDLELAIEIVEDLLTFVYELHPKTLRLSKVRRAGPKFLVADDTENSDS